MLNSPMCYFLLHVPKLDLATYCAGKHGRTRVVEDKRVRPTSGQVFMDGAVSLAGAIIDKLISVVEAEGHLTAKSARGVYLTMQFGAAHNVRVYL
jgi:hypothetical protein